MATSDRLIDRGRRDGARHLLDLGTEFREARLAAGLSQATLGRAVGASHAGISRIENAAARNVSIRQMDELAAVLGLRLSVKLYPSGRPLRDAAQLALLERLRSHLPRSLVWRTEVPLALPGDLRAWDASIDGDGWTMFVDAETRIRDVQALERRTALKQRDTGTNRVILLIADTRSNRAVLSGIGHPLIRDARSGSSILAALAAGLDPGGSGIVLL